MELSSLKVKPSTRKEYVHIYSRTPTATNSQQRKRKKLYSLEPQMSLQRQTGDAKLTHLNYVLYATPSSLSPSLSFFCIPLPPPTRLFSLPIPPVSRIRDHNPPSPLCSHTSGSKPRLEYLTEKLHINRNYRSPLC